MYSLKKTFFIELLKNSDAPTGSVDTDGRLTFFNEAFCLLCKEILHIEITEGLCLHEVLPEPAASVWKDLYTRALAQNACQDECTLGADVILNLRCTPLEENGAPAGVAVFAHNKSIYRDDEETLRHLGAAADCSREAILTYTPDGKILTWNRSAQTIFGFEASEVIGKPLATVVPAERISSVQAHISKILSGSVSATETIGLGLRRDGRRISISVSSWPVRNQEGRITAIASSLRDITNRHDDEQVQAFLSALVESSEDAIHSIALDGTILSWNKGAERMCGYSREEIVGKHISILASRTFEEILKNLESIRRGEPVPVFDTVWRHKNGNEIDVSIVISPLRSPDGTIICAAEIARNIGQHKKLMRALVEAERKYRTIFDGALEGMYQTSLDGRVLTVNTAAARMLGYHSPRELIAMVHDVGDNVWVSQRTRARYLRAVAHPAGEAVLGFECQFRRKNGQIIWVSLNGRLVRDDNGRPLYHEGFIEDITVRKMATEAMAESESRFRHLFEDSGTVLLLVEPISGLITDANHAAAVYYGYPREQLVGANITLLNILPKNKIHEERERAVREERNYFNFQHRLASGEIRDVHVYSSPVDIGGRTLLYSIIFDVTEQVRAEKQLLENAEILNEAQKIGGLGTYTLNIATEIWSSSNVLDEIFGIGPEYVRDIDGWTRLIHPEDRAAVIEHFVQGVLKDKNPFDYEYRILRYSDKAERWVHGQGKLESNAEGLSIRLSGVIKDITEHKRAELAVRQSEVRYRRVFQASLDCIAISRLSDGTLIDVNQSYLDLLGFSIGEVIGKTCVDLNLWAEQGARERMAEILREEGGFRDARTRYRKKNGELIWVLISSSTIDIDGDPCVLSIIRDVSDAKAAEDKIWNLAFYDPLTRLPNRRLLMDRLRQLLNAGARTLRMRALLFIDLDNFKTLNDTLGHQNGDELLREVAQRLVACVRESDTVARLGGDEFIVLLDGLDYHPENAAAQAETIAKKILGVIEIPFTLNGREYFSTSSIGITLFSGNQINANDLLRQADIAMYQAKSAGRNTSRFFAPELQTAVQERAELVGEMRAAIKKDEFVLYLQPQINANCIAGAEALIRWRHPQRGLLLPYDFIPLAEETGQILPLGEWILESACALIASWQDQAPLAQQRLSVNISARQFHQPGFVGQVRSALAKFNADPTLLMLEITESILLDNIDEAIAKMNELKSSGISFSLDDFGTGYSSLSYLKRLPFDQVKIDRSFVRDLLSDLGSRAIAQTIISLGHALGLDVLAEGVETTEQRALLAELGCHSFQGYLFGRPGPIAEFEELCRKPEATCNDSAKFSV